jgi:putative membrane protein
MSSTGDLLLGLFPWLKVNHVVAVISWMAGLLYLPRLFVYHCEAEAGSAQSETFKVMESKLTRVIMGPAMITTLVFGFAMLMVPGYLASAGLWLWLKVALVVGLVGVHFFLMSCRNAFAEDRNARPQRFFRIINEVPTVLMIGIVILVVVRPF